VANFCALYALTVWTSPRRFAVGFTIVMTAVLATSLGPGATLKQAVGFGVVEGVVMLLVRRVIGDRDRRAQIAERERDVAAREAVVEERARIARELHDVIAHHVSMIVLQAGAERRVLDDSNASTREVLESVEQIGRGALTEMRRLLGMLRGDAHEPLSPQPGLDDVPTLVGQLREAGLPVELKVEGERRELPVGIELSAYRIVQEALTNTLKYAGTARACVRVGFEPGALELEVADDGDGDAAVTPGGSGHGLMGMSERVALFGGVFEAGPRPEGGYRVRARLPLRDGA
jgi:signal transduction histidine kinase